MTMTNMLNYIKNGDDGTLRQVLRDIPEFIGNSTSADEGGNDDDTAKMLALADAALAVLAQAVKSPALDIAVQCVNRALWISSYDQTNEKFQ